MANQPPENAFLAAFNELVAPDNARLVHAHQRSLNIAPTMPLRQRIGVYRRLGCSLGQQRQEFGFQIGHAAPLNTARNPAIFSFALHKISSSSTGSPFTVASRSGEFPTSAAAMPMPSRCGNRPATCA